MTYHKHLTDALRQGLEMIAANPGSHPALAVIPAESQWIVYDESDAAHLYRLHHTPGAIPAMRLSEWSCEAALLADPPDKLATTIMGWAISELRDYRTITPGNFLTVPIPHEPNDQAGPPPDHTEPVLQAGDGTLQCEACWRRTHPDKPLPDTGWIVSQCDDPSHEESA